MTPSGLPTWARIGIGAVVWIAFLAYVHRLAPRDPLRRVTTGYEAELADALLPETPLAPDAVERILTRLA